MSESMQPPYGPAPPPLAGPELPSFRYALGATPTNFGVEESVFEKMPMDAVIMPEGD